MSERNDENEKSTDDDAQPRVARRLASSDNAGSEFETREMPVMPDSDETEIEDGEGPAANRRHAGSERETRHVDKTTDEFDSDVRVVADHTGSEDDTDFEPAEDDAEEPGEAPTKSANQPAKKLEDQETREVTALKDEWKENAAKVAEELGETAAVAGDWDADDGDESLAASVVAATGESPLPREQEPADIAGPVIEQSRAAQESWNKLRFEQRMVYFDALRAELVDQRSDYAPSMATAIGRPMVEALTGEYQPVLETLRTLEYVTPPLLVDDHGAPGPLTHGDIDASMALTPYGVVMVANAARSPFALPMSLAIDALAGGNSVLICGSETHPRINEMMRKLFKRANFPPGLIQVTAGDSETLRAIIDARPDKVIYEGEVENAARVAGLCVLNACEFHHVRDAKNAMIVLEDAGIEFAVMGALQGAYAGGGMLQGTLQRVVVHDAIYDEFRMKFIESIREMNGHHAQLAHIKEAYSPARAKVLIEDAVSKGARVAFPAGEAPGRWIHWKAGLVESLSPKAKLSRESFDGPCVALYRSDYPVGEIRDLLEIAPANNLSVLGAPTREMMAALEALPVSRLSIGEPISVGASLGGGVPIGSEMPRTACGPLAMLRPKVTQRSEGGRHRVSWYPYTDDKAYAMMEALEAMYGVKPGQRIAGSFKLILNSAKRRLLKGED